MSVARYTFMPWLRRGIANEIPTPATESRAFVDVTVTVASEVATDTLPPRRVQLVGPGDIVGLNSQVVVRTEPRNWTTDFEPNYVPFVEFYDEDFAWRYTPAPPDPSAHRLAPWITLLVLKEDEFTRNTSPSRPLPSITLRGVTADAVLPPASQLWSWAHVHINERLGSDHVPDLAALDAVLGADPDRGYCRLVAPRRLEPNAGYYAFVIPTFESGRKAGLGLSVGATDPGLAIAWTIATEFPVYFEWFFRTGAAGDFEALVRALKARAIDERVGIRDLDIQAPGFTLPAITSGPDDVVGLEGALVSPSYVPKPLDPASNFPPEIERLVNLSADVASTGTAQDPVVTAPLYGRWHALVERISADPNQRDWVNELNVDPRFRSASGLGTRVVQARQEEYMRLAWQQIGEIIAANRKIHFSQVAVQASQKAFIRDVASLPTETAVAITAPTFTKIMGSPVTLYQLVKESQLPRASLSSAFRKQVRPRGGLARRTFSGRRMLAGAIVGDAVRRLNEGSISAAPPRALPSGPTLERILERSFRRPSDAIRGLAENRLLILLFILFVAVFVVLAAPLPQVIILAAVAVALAILAYWWFGQQVASAEVAEILDPASLTPEAARDAPPNAMFAIGEPGVPPGAAGPPTGGPGGGGATVDSDDARDFRAALIEFHEMLAVTPPPGLPRRSLALDEIHATVMRAIEPVRAFPARLAPVLRVGERSIGAYIGGRYIDTGGSDDVAGGGAGTGGASERIVPVMAYPDIKAPMYEPLRDISSELLVPNLHLIEPNTISLMLRNQPFIEAYMVGLNHEFARELLWREYPTDQRPSTFRQFWDVSNFVDTEGLPPAVLAEKLRDIQRLHEWPSTSQLGEHNNRRKPTDPPETQATPLGQRPVVLVIRGDLLKRYPNTIIYAQRARWGDRPGHTLRLTLWDETGERTEADPADPNIRFPLYKAQVFPDIHFIGFDLPVDEVRGDPTLEETAEAKARIPANRLGWFFALKEVAGEPRFGLDEAPPDAPGDVKWDNLSWANIDLAGRQVIDVARPFTTEPGGTRTEGVDWGTNAADMAFILYQKPVLVAVHGREMLRAVT